jgi:dipeptidase E
MKLFLASRGQWMNPSLEKAFLDLIVKPIDENKLIILSINTTSEAHKERLFKAKKWYIEQGFQEKNIDILNLKTDNILNFHDIDVLHIWGGNNYHYLQGIREAGLEPKIREFIDRDGVYVGTSAGSNIMSPDVDENLSNDVNDIGLDDVSGFGYVDFITIPHWDTAHGEKRARQIKYSWKSGKRVIPITDQQAVLVQDNGFIIISP